MSAVTFTHFTDLAGELRSMIWTHAIVTQINDITARLPKWCLGESAVRRRLALVGHHTLPTRHASQFFHLRLRDPYNGRKMRIEEDDFEDLVHSLPLAAVCREARAHVADVCLELDLAPHMVFHYYNDKLWSLEPPGADVDELLLRDVHCIPGVDESLEHVFARPTTLTVYGGRAEFRSAEHLVGLISRFFGDRIERVILKLWIQAGDPRTRPYWMDSAEVAVADFEFIMTEELWLPASTIQVTRDGKLYVSNKTWQEGGWAVVHLATHLLKCYEILDVSSKRLPRLKHIDLNLRIESLVTTREEFEASCVDGVFTSKLQLRPTAPSQTPTH